MSQLKATPGPWHLFASDYAAEHHHSVEVNAEDGLTVAYAHKFVNEFTPEGEANAHLIAAAPELYEALDGLLPLVREALRACIDDPSLPGSITSRLGCAYERADEAQTKARGESA